MTASHAVERDLRRAAPAFDLPALLDVLALLGRGEADVTFRSELCVAIRRNVVQALAFDGPTAEVTTRIGLLGAQSPLPSFFLEALETLEDTALLDLIGALDHHALALRFASLYPERDPRLAGGLGWEATKRRVTHGLGLASPSSLHWLFSQVFPELAVVVRRGHARRRIPGPDARLGALRLAAAALGGDVELPAGGVEVILDARDVPPPAPAWTTEVARRMRDQILPTLTGVELDLTVWLRLDDVPHHLRLAVDPLGGPTLGADRPGDPDPLTEPTTTSRLLLICSGAIATLHFPAL